MIEIADEYLSRRVQVAEYFQIPNTCITVCTLHLASGNVVTGESSVSRPESFDAARGREIAYDKAMKRLRDFETFFIVERQYEAGLTDGDGPKTDETRL